MDEVHQNSTGRNLFQRHRQKSEEVGKVFSKGSDKNPTIVGGGGGGGLGL